VWADWHGAALAALAAADQDGAVRQAHICDLHGDDFSGPDTGLEHQPDDGLVAAVPQVGALAGGEQGLELVVVEGVYDLLVQPRRPEADELVGVDLLLVGQPGREPPQGELSGPSGGWFGSGRQQVGDEPGHGGTVQHAGPASCPAPGQEAADPVAVRLDGLRAFSLGAQVQLPGGQQCREVGWQGGAARSVS
jgi:hypothetical protein